MVADDNKARGVVGASSGNVEKLEETSWKCKAKGELSEMNLSDAPPRRVLMLLW
jgi:hypothetical protein